MFCLLGLVSFAVDFGLLFHHKIDLQKVADAAAIAGAAELTSGNWSAAAQDSATQNGVTNGIKGAIVNASLGTTYHPNAVKVVVSQPEPTYFMKLFGYRTVTVGATAVAGQTSSRACLYALNLAPFKDDGITMNGTGDLCMGTTSVGGVCTPTCGIYDNSGLLTHGSSGAITATWIGVTGTYSGGDASPQPITGMTPVPDPMSYWTDPKGLYASCANDPHATSGAVTPGCYKGLTVSGTATLSGMYVVRGKLTVSVHNPIANGVTFYIDGTQGGSLGSLDGAVLTAPVLASSGACSNVGCNGILIWDTEVNSPAKPQQGISFGPINATLTGILYFPNASLKFHGDNTTILNSDIIASAYVFDGTVNINDYKVSPGQAPILISSTLME
jgi:hypothetical protein